MNALSSHGPDSLAPRRFARARGGLLVALGIASAGCGDPAQFLPPDQIGAPKGALDGTVTYTGPLPCTEKGRILGAAVLLVFDVRQLPPPDGLGTQPGSLAVVGGDELFAGVRGRLTFNSDGSRACPAEGLPPVNVSAPWVAAPLEAGTYQVRGFYDLDGNFDPVFSIANLPSRGDVAGGAIDNPVEVLAGKSPIYREITLGTRNPDGTREIPALGARIGGITVNLGLSLPLDRPVFYPKDVLDETTAGNKDPRQITMPSDFQLATFSAGSPVATEKSFIRIKLGAGVPPEEADVASRKPFYMPTKTPAPSFFMNWQDVNGDGKRNIADDHIPDSPQIPSLYPISIFTKIHVGTDPVSKQDPTVLLLGITLYKSLIDTAVTKPTFAEVQPELIIGLRPAALCIPADPSKPGMLVVTHRTDSANNPVLLDEFAVKATLKAQFKRPIELTYGCVPEGPYTMNLLYETGQGWTVPNEAGICSSTEPISADGKQCIGQGDGHPARARLASQSAVLTVTKPTDPTYCKELPPACLRAQASP